MQKGECIFTETVSSNLTRFSYAFYTLSDAAIYTLIAFGIYVFITRLINFRLRRKQNYTFLELIPPAHKDKSGIATDELFNLLHDSNLSQTRKERLLFYEPTFSLEIVSTKADGVRFIAGVQKWHYDQFCKLVESYQSDIKIKEVEDHIPAEIDESTSRIISIKQRLHFVFPIAKQRELTEHDPLAYITGAMANLQDDELVALQFVVAPIHSRKAASIARRISAGKNIDAATSPLLMRIVMYAVFVITAPLLIVIGYFTGGATKKQSKYQQEELDEVYRKVTSRQFRVNIRALAITEDVGSSSQYAKHLADSLNFKAKNGQILRAKKQSFSFIGSHWLELFKLRAQSLFKRSANILSSEELASLYHFPNSVSAKTDNVIKSHSKTLPAPVSLKGTAKPDVLIGENRHHGVTTPIGLSEAERQRHMFIIGGTGNGKTTMIKYQIIQDMQSGKGVAVVDPHGDLAEELLGHIPEERMKDVIYIDPYDLDHPVGINLLELSTGKDGKQLTGNELIREKDTVTEAMISVLRKVFSDDDMGGHRIEYVLRNAIHTALVLPDATIFTILELLTDPKLRKQAIKLLDPKEDKDLINFWKNELGGAGKMQAVKMSAGVTAKIGRFKRSGSARAVLEQPTSTVDFSRLMDEQKILICNLSKGKLGEDTSALFGTTILTKLQLAALKRSIQKQKDRSDFYVYVDEFQNFATLSFTQMLSEARKYKLFLTMAEQTTSQQDEQRLVDIILANVGTVVAFRSGSPRDEQLILPLFKPYIEEGEISNLPAYNFYCRIAAITTQEPMSGVTVVIEDEDVKMVKKVKRLSRKTYSCKVNSNQGEKRDTSKNRESKKPQ